MSGETAPTAARMVLFSLMDMEQLALRLGVSRETASAIAEEEGWRQHRGRYGEARVSVPETVLQHGLTTPPQAPLERYYDVIGAQVMKLRALQKEAGLQRPEELRAVGNV